MSQPEVAERAPRGGLDRIMRAAFTRFVTTHGLYVALLAVLLPVYWWQLRYGVDISDEGYYVVHPASWLRTSSAETGNLSPHQFSAVLYYPLVRVYALLHPDLAGIILFLRRAYLCGSVLTCFAAYRFFLRVVSPAVATLSALSLLVFIPLSLPTLSYNTLALFGLGSGLFTLARALIDRDATGKGGWPSLVVATGLMAIGGCAYPSVALLAPLAIAALFWLFPTQRRYLLIAFVALVLFAGAVFTVITIQLGGLERVAEIVDFSRKLYAGSMGEKIEAARESLFGMGQLYLPCSLTLLLGTVRRIFRSAAARPLFLVGLIAVVGWWLTGNRPSALFTKGHDVVFILCAGFLPLLPLPRPSLPPADRLLAVMLLVGLFGGVLVASSAVAGLINYPILGILAVSCGLALSARGDGRSEAVVAGACGVVAVVAWSTLTYVYAEVPLASPTVAPTAYSGHVRRGPYDGLRTQPWKRDLLEGVKDQLRLYESRCRTIDFWMSSSGLYLDTPFELRTPMPYWLEDVKTTHLREKLIRHYENERNRPDLVILWTMTQQQDTTVNREQLAVLAAHYREQKAESPIRIFLRADLADEK